MASPVPIQKVAAIVDDPGSSVAAFVGTTSSGPLNSAVRVAGFADFTTTFGPATDTPELADAVRLYFLNGGTAAIVVRVPDGADVRATTIGSAAQRTGLHSLDGSAGFGMIVLPGVADPATLVDASSYASSTRAFLLIDAPADAHTANDIAQRMQSGAFPASADAALYFPWLSVDGTRVVGPSGAVAGLFARNDAAHGIWSSPAGSNACVVGVAGLATTLSAADAARLNDLGVDTLRLLPPPSTGPVVWGARTLAGPADAATWRYVAVRRTALHLEHSIARGLSWVASRPDGAALWTQIAAVVGTYLDGLFHRGAFQGVTPQQAWYVRCDATTTTANDTAQGIANVVVGFAPLKPAEFVTIRISVLANMATPPP